MYILSLTIIVLRLIETTMSTVYDKICQVNFRSVGSFTNIGSDTIDAAVVSFEQNTYVDLPRDFFQMIAAIGPYLYRDTILLQKVLY